MPLSLTFSTDISVARPALTLWRGCFAEHVTVPAGAAYEFAHAGDLHYLALHDIRLKDGELNVDTLAPVQARDLRDTITFIPQGCAISGWAKPEARQNAFTAIYFDPGLIHEELEARYQTTPPPPTIYARDAALQSTLTKIKTVVSGGAADPLQAESLCLLAALEVFGIIASPATGQLSDRQMALVRAYIDEHMEQPISLSQLAHCAGLSRFHFARAFKATTGQSPYRFVTTLRVEAASRMLVSSNLPLNVVAACVGFSSLVQFRRAFQDRMGTSPLAYRRHIQ